MRQLRPGLTSGGLLQLLDGRLDKAQLSGMARRAISQIQDAVTAGIFLLSYDLPRRSSARILRKRLTWRSISSGVLHPRSS
jgi:hypothetical protein